MERKYRFNMLDIEITRKCNKRCAHCLRGEAQDISMNEEIIDCIFDEVKDVKRIVFGNGEPLLEVEKISYFIDKLVNSQWSTQAIEITTNGILLDRRIVDIFELFCLWKHGASAVIRISNDQYHNAEEYENAYAFYKPLVEEANQRIKQIKPYSLIDLHYTRSESGDGQRKLPGLVYSGRATEIEGMVLGKNAVLPCTYKRRIKVVGTDIPCALQISANGNVTFCEPASYPQLDDISIGNIAEYSLYELINKNNDDCPVLCSEIELIYRAKHNLSKVDLGCAQLDFNKLIEKIGNSIIKLRYRAIELFPNIPAQMIIESLPLPNPNNFYSLAMDIYKHCPYYTENMIANINKYADTRKAHIYVGAMYKAVLMYLNGRKPAYKYPYWLFGNTEEIDEYLIQLFEDLNLRYKKNPEEANNNKVFPCKPGIYNIIDYSEEVSASTWDDYSVQVAADAIARAFEELKHK